MPTSDDTKPMQAGQQNGADGARSSNELPPLCNTGVTGKDLRGKHQFGPDWLRYSAAHGGSPSDYVPSHPVFEVVGEAPYPLKRYKSAVLLHAGRVDWNDERPSQRVLVNIDGAGCDLSRVQGVDFREILNHAIYGIFGKVTRLDFQATVCVDGASPLNVLRAFEDGRVKTPACTCDDTGGRYKGGEDKGRTVYIGSRKSGRVLRVYDKAAQLGIDGPIIRIELESKGQYAEALARSMLLNGVILAGKQAIREFVQIEGVQWFTDAIESGDCAWFEPIERKETDRQRWYRDQIIPAARKDLKRNDKAGQWLAFQLQGLLDEAGEVEAHGGEVTPLENTRKGFRGMKVLAREGFVGPEFRHAFEVAGKEFIASMCERLGYTWDTKAQEWRK